MKVIQPLEVTEARFTSSNVPEADYPAYDPAVTYAVEDRVQITDGVHTVFEAVRQTTGEYPPDNLKDQRGAEAAWIKVAATNRWAMFDGVVGNSTKSDAEFQDGSGLKGIDVVLSPARVVNSIAFFGLSGDMLKVFMEDGDVGKVYEKGVSLISWDNIATWYDFFSEPIERKSDMVLTDLPNYGTAQIHIQVISPVTPAEIGLAIPGVQRDIGLTSYGASVGIIDYSKKDTDEFGQTSVIKRSYSKTMSLDVEIDNPRIDFVQRFLATLRAEPVVWSGHSMFGALLVYGYYREFDIVIEDYSSSQCSIEIEGLT